MLKRTAQPFFTKAQQRHETAIRKIAVQAATDGNRTLVKKCDDELRASRKAQAKRSQRVRALAPWSPMPRHGWRVEKGVEIRR